MKNKIILFLILIFGCVTFSSYAQQRIVVENDAFMVFENNTFLVIDNKNANAITTVNGANIISEDETRIIKWNTLDGTGNYTIPYTTNSHVKIPLSTQLNTQGTGNQAYIQFSTFETANDDNTGYATGVTNMNGPCSPDIGLNVVDRFWMIDASSYATKPSSTISFGYDNAANEVGATNVINQAALKAMRFDLNTGSWGIPSNLFGNVNLLNVAVENAVVSSNQFHKIWTLVDTSVFIINAYDTIQICSGQSVLLGGAYQTTTGTYIDTVFSSVACDTVWNTYLNVIPTPDPTITSATNFCVSENDISLTAVDTGGAWSGTGVVNGNFFSPSIAGVGTHQITYSISGFCPVSSFTTITVAPIETAVLTPSGPFCLYSESVVLEASIPGGIWSGPGIIDGNLGLFDPATASSGLHVITYTLTGFCQGDTTMKINVKDFLDPSCTDVECGEVFVPNGFTPDGNSLNECIRVYGDCITSMDFAIYSRWGELVYRSNMKDDCWDGTFKGEQLNTGVFAYKLEAKLLTGEVIRKSGNITLFR